ncbi:uncharacterized protein JN550_012340 [Neoarthrinium moseri]|uniref:uncharacterized protein n=1 Tax=Neoarthrinium moseri TaxID=1658444 RepID=UPI001FDB590C|nr:uncharacterized protein JN550_012340 [Neoarthrinium moseri]KAI1858881.1 hypothetical protein JN550_012340 [Neoarthrinium moseri]
MKSTTVAMGLLAGVASASYNHPRHFHAPRPYYRRDNSTAPTQTTLTVQLTQVHTVTSCAPTVTNCPGRNNTEAYATMPASELTTAEVTQVIDLTTTVCPVTAAESVSSAVVGSHSSGLIPGTTHDVTPTVSSGNSGVTVTASVRTTDVPLTMTVGPESSKSVVVTTIHSTYTQQVTVTLTKSGSTTAESNSPVGGSGNGSGSEGSSAEGTTTTTSTSTGTRTVTVARSSTATTYPTGASGNSGSTGSSGNSDNNGSSGSGSGSDSETCPEAVTVTVTAPASTVYVTQTAPSAAATGASGNSGSTGSGNSGSTGSGNSGSGSSGSSDDADEGSDDGEDGDDCPTETEDSGVVTATATATVVPYPVGPVNGTYPTPTAVPTGLFRVRN